MQGFPYKRSNNIEKKKQIRNNHCCWKKKTIKYERGVKKDEEPKQAGPDFIVKPKISGILGAIILSVRLSVRAGTANM